MAVPLCLGFYYSFTDWNGLSPNFNFVGFKNYLNIFKEKRFFHSLQFTLKFVVLNTLIQNLLALTFALILNTKIKGRQFLKIIIFIPCLLSPILCGYLWSKIFGQLLPAFSNLFGWNIDLNLLANPKTVLAGLLIINNWQWIGYWMIIYLAGLHAIPNELYEAISIDGGKILDKFFHIILPLIAPSITICVVYITVGSFQTYELILAATNGGPGHASEILVMYIYNVAFGNDKYGFASANSILFFTSLLVLAIFQLKILRKREVQL